MRYIDKSEVSKILNNYLNGYGIPTRKKIFHHNIENTLNDKVYYILNQEEKIEWSKCYNDIIYFIETYLNIKLREYQKNWIKLYQENRFTIYNTSRQTGHSIIFSAIHLHNIIFQNKNIVLYSNNLSSGVEFLNKLKMHYYQLPYFLKPNIRIFNNKKIVFTTGSIVINIKKSINNFDIYHFDNMAFNNSDIYQNVFPEIAVSSKSKLIIQSTPCGINQFYDLYKNSILPDDAPDKNCFKSIQTFWWEVEGRDEEWKRKTIAELGSEEAFNQEYNLEFLKYNK